MQNSSEPLPVIFHSPACLYLNSEQKKMQERQNKELWSKTGYYFFGSSLAVKPRVSGDVVQRMYFSYLALSISEHTKRINCHWATCTTFEYIHLPKVVDSSWRLQSSLDQVFWTILSRQNMTPSAFKTSYLHEGRFPSPYYLLRPTFPSYSILNSSFPTGSNGLYQNFETHYDMI